MVKDTVRPSHIHGLVPGWGTKILEAVLFLFTH